MNLALQNLKDSENKQKMFQYGSILSAATVQHLGAVGRQCTSIYHWYLDTCNHGHAWIRGPAWIGAKLAFRTLLRAPPFCAICADRGHCMATCRLH
jgi:hypothetical protein